MTANACTGHRQRVLQKIKKQSYDKFFDYEIVEAMLFLIFKRKDTKPIAKILIKTFKNINGILSASEENLLKINGIGPSTVDAFRIIETIIKASLRATLEERTAVSSYNDVINFCRASMKNLTNEILTVLSLNSRLEVIDVAEVQRGTTDSIAIYPCEVLKHCIQNGAAAFILVHNHPSGDPTPSRRDVEVTKMLQRAAECINIPMLDHIIIAGDKHTSFKRLKLIKKRKNPWLL